MASAPEQLETSAVTCDRCGHTAHLVADRVLVSFMTDGHFFLRVPNVSPEKIVDWICDQLPTDEGDAQNWTRYGMLCRVGIYAGERKLREIGDHVHTRSGKPEDIEKFRNDAQAWVDAIHADHDAPRLMAARGSAQ